jgi:hypothetical protein
VNRLPLYTVVSATDPTATNAGSQPSRLNACGSSHRLRGKAWRGRRARRLRRRGRGAAGGRARGCQVVAPRAASPPRARAPAEHSPPSELQRLRTGGSGRGPGRAAGSNVTRCGRWCRRRRRPRAAPPAPPPAPPPVDPPRTSSASSVCCTVQRLWWGDASSSSGAVTDILSGAKEGRGQRRVGRRAATRARGASCGRGCQRQGPGAAAAARRGRGGAARHVLWAARRRARPAIAAPAAYLAPAGPGLPLRCHRSGLASRPAPGRRTGRGWGEQSVAGRGRGPRRAVRKGPRAVVPIASWRAAPGVGVRARVGRRGGVAARKAPPRGDGFWGAPPGDAGSQRRRSRRAARGFGRGAGRGCAAGEGAGAAARRGAGPPDRGRALSGSLSGFLDTRRLGRRSLGAPRTPGRRPGRQRWP